ncbi:MAG: helix-turn-helix domain-containing protein [Eubacterium ramulus]
MTSSVPERFCCLSVTVRCWRVIIMRHWGLWSAMTGKIIPNIWTCCSSIWRWTAVQALADAVYVHRNTINYQLNKIKKILGKDFSSLQSRFELILAYQIRELL